MCDLSQPNSAGLQEGRAVLRKRCYVVALANTPPNVLCVKIRRNLTGRAFLKTGILAAPRPATRKALYIYLHECAHFALHADRRKPRHVEEMEAEQWAHDRMRQAGIPVPRSMTKRAKAYVRWKIEQAIRRGAKRIASEARRWAAS